MDHVGGNGGNGSGDVEQGYLEQQFNNGGFDFILNEVAAREEDPLEEFEEALWDEIEADVDQLGLAQPPEMNPEEIDMLDSDENFRFLSLYNPQPPQSLPGSEPWTNVTPDHMNRASDPYMGFSIGVDPNKIIQQATRALEELVKLATMGEPVWERNGEMETLNGIQYLREFCCVDATVEDIMRMVEVGEPQMIPSFDDNDSYFAPNIPTLLSLTLGSEPLHVEASRDVGFVNMNPMNIVAFLMDWNQWTMAFPSIVSRATLQGVVLGSVDGSYNGVLHVMTAEFHQATPLIAARKSYFARYCKMIAYGTWVVVDVGLENLLPYPQLQFRRKPSGCLIEEMPRNGSYSKITWVEHVEADHASLHPLFRPIVSSGFAFGAKRWIAGIKRYCQWLTTSMARTIPTHAGVLVVQPGRESVLKMAEEMTRNFFKNASSCTENSWMRFPLNFGAEDARIRFGNILAIPGMPPSNTLIFTTFVRIPVPMKILFDFLQDGRSRLRWDLFSSGRIIRELACVRNGENPENRVSIIQVNSSPNTIEILYLQESYYDETGSYVVYERLDVFALSFMLNGGYPNIPDFLPSGFSILPDKPPGQGGEPMGSILMLAFQVDNTSTDEFIPLSTFNTINAFLGRTIALIRDAFR